MTHILRVPRSLEQNVETECSSRAVAMSTYLVFYTIENLRQCRMIGFVYFSVFYITQSKALLNELANKLVLSQKIC